MKPNEYECAVCHNIYEKGWTDEEAESELKGKFGENAAPENSELVCDDCYKNMFN